MQARRTSPVEGEHGTGRYRQTNKCPAFRLARLGARGCDSRALAPGVALNLVALGLGATEMPAEMHGKRH